MHPASFRTWVQADHLVWRTVSTVLKSDTLTEYIVRFPIAVYTASEKAAALSAEKELNSAPVICSQEVSSVCHEHSPQATRNLHRPCLMQDYTTCAPQPCSTQLHAAEWRGFVGTCMRDRASAQ